MESEKVKEIKKALENNKTEHFLFINENKWKYSRYVDILTYINELERENERFKEKQLKAKEIMKSGELSKITKQNMYYYYLTNSGYLENEIKRQKEFVSKKGKEIKKLKDRIAELEEDKEKWQRKAINYYEKAKSYGIECIIDTDIDETLKEFLND